MKTLGQTEFQKGFLNDNPNFIKALKSLSYKKRRDFFKLLIKESDDIEFLSKVSEFKFGLKLDKMFKILEYEKKVGNKTPDWIVESNNQKIIFEVKRLNKAEGVMKKKIKQYGENFKYTQNPIPTIEKIIESIDTKYIFGHYTKIKEKGSVYHTLINKMGYKLVLCLDFGSTDSFYSDIDLFDGFTSRYEGNPFFSDVIFRTNVSAIIGYLSSGEFGLIINKSCPNSLNASNVKDLKNAFPIYNEFKL